jgi:formiminotetrahydrofolate cyclodeaminase
MNVTDQTVGEFLSNVASESVAPAGGTAAAVVGGVGAALCEMGCVHALTGETGATDELTGARDELAARRDRLLALGNADAELVDEAFGSSTPGADVDWKRAVGVPLATAETCGDVLDIAAVVVDQCESATVADVRTGVRLGEAALRASVFTARANAARVDDESFLADVDRRVGAVEAAADAAVEQVVADTPVEVAFE